MRRISLVRAVVLGGAGALAFAAVALAANGSPTQGQFQFEPLAASTACTNGGNATAPFTIPAGYSQSNIASEPQFADAPDMITQNESGKNAGRYLYQPSEATIGEVTVTDLWTGTTTRLAFRPDWERMDTIAWTPWGTILVGEESNSPAAKPRRTRHRPRLGSCTSSS